MKCILSVKVEPENDKKRVFGHFLVMAARRATEFVRKVETRIPRPNVLKRLFYKSYKPNAFYDLYGLDYREILNVLAS